MKTATFSPLDPPPSGRMPIWFPRSDAVLFRTAVVLVISTSNPPARSYGVNRVHHITECNNRLYLVLNTNKGPRISTLRRSKIRQQSTGETINYFGLRNLQCSNGLLSVRKRPIQYWYASRNSVFLMGPLGQHTWAGQSTRKESGELELLSLIITSMV